VRPQGGAHAWARLSNEVKTFKDIIAQAGIERM
jgi:hypothetical protein